ncbi:MAG: hypothetical protein FJX25_02375 [Alphaproteobacteria bacterium]|uniref:Uncharacterized protein n=1 Tax=Paracoccus angustae TaxID=1671480 RepID=A0ABV7TZM8_9RHOB|nr:hypothetical protein [Alphaproteobacteria bacterium]
MATLILRDPSHIDALAKRLSERKLPLTVSWAQGASLSGRQQRLSFRWYQDISRQLGDMDVETVRADCKVTHGVPILSGDSDGFRDSWQRSIGRFDYEGQREIVKRLQVPVTSLMSVKQMTAYLDAVHQRYAPQGVRLTDPEALKYEEEFA